MPLALLALAVAAFGIGTITGVSPHGVTIMLLLFGVGLTAGSMLGGRLTDSHLLPSLVGMALVVASGADLADLPWTGALVSGLTVLTALFFIYLQRRSAVAANVSG
jgi:predicted MFS family arabinose efflux permease